MPSDEFFFEGQKNEIFLIKYNGIDPHIYRIKKLFKDNFFYFFSSSSRYLYISNYFIYIIINGAHLSYFM